MTVISLPTRPIPTQGRDLAARTIAGLAPQVDHLYELRTLIRQAQAVERQITQELLGVLAAQGLGALQGQRAVAILESRTSLHVDAALFLEAAGSRAPEALTVSVTAARRLLGEAELDAISETLTTSALRVEPLGETAA